MSGRAYGGAEADGGLIIGQMCVWSAGGRLIIVVRSSTFFSTTQKLCEMVNDYPYSLCYQKRIMLICTTVDCPQLLIQTCQNKPRTGRTGQCMNHAPAILAAPAAYCIHDRIIHQARGHQTVQNVSEKHAPSPSAATSNTHRPSNCSNF